MNWRGPLTEERVALAHDHLWVIDWVIDRHRWTNLDREDQWQDGYFGLLRATADWDPERSKFSTYATAWVRAAIGQGVWRYEGSSYRRTVEGRGDEWHAPSRLDAPLSGEDTRTLADLLVETPDDRDAGSTLSDEDMARVQAIHDACRDDIDRAIVRNLGNGVGALGVAKEFGVSVSLPAVRKRRLRERLGLTA